jgi:hypothetical protein
MISYSKEKPQEIFIHNSEQPPKISNFSDISPILTFASEQESPNPFKSHRTPSNENFSKAQKHGQNVQMKKEEIDFFDNDEDEENEKLYKEYIMMKNNKNRASDVIKNINEKIKLNKNKIEEISNKLLELKEEKNKKNEELINLLSSKESIEENYKNQIYFNVYNPIKLNNSNNKNIQKIENGISDETTFKIDINDIKESDSNLYKEQVLALLDDIDIKNDGKINQSIFNIIKNSYDTILKNNQSIKDKDKMTNNFFSKLSLFLSRFTYGRYSESKICLFLRYIMKMNSINVTITKDFKFINKDYKDQKIELKNMKGILEKKNNGLNEKIVILENIIKDYDKKIEFLEKNEVFHYKKDNNDKEYYVYNSKKEKKNGFILNESEGNEKNKYDTVLSDDFPSLNKSPDILHKDKTKNLTIVPKIEHSKIQTKTDNNVLKKTNKIRHQRKNNLLLNDMDDNLGILSREVEQSDEDNVQGSKNYTQYYTHNNVNRSEDNNHLLTMDKENKTIRIGNRSNHNFISIVNLTKNEPYDNKNTQQINKTSKVRKYEGKIFNTETYDFEKSKNHRNEKNQVENLNKDNIDKRDIVKRPIIMSKKKENKSYKLIINNSNNKKKEVKPKIIKSLNFGSEKKNIIPSSS